MRDGRSDSCPPIGVLARSIPDNWRTDWTKGPATLARFLTGAAICSHRSREGRGYPCSEHSSRQEALFGGFCFSSSQSPPSTFTLLPVAIHSAPPSVCRLPTSLL